MLGDINKGIYKIVILDIYGLNIRCIHYRILPVYAFEHFTINSDKIDLNYVLQNSEY